MNRDQLAVWLREADRSQMLAIRELAARTDAMPDGERKSEFIKIRERLIERNLEFHAVLFETDDGQMISLAQINLAPNGARNP